MQLIRERNCIARFVDFTKAFDYINRDILYGTNLLNWEGRGGGKGNSF